MKYKIGLGLLLVPSLMVAHNDPSCFGKFKKKVESYIPSKNRLKDLGIVSVSLATFYDNGSVLNDTFRLCGAVLYLYGSFKR